jgi:prepilin-type N-terminal cleavage/methylation domain-containing protein
MMPARRSEAGVSLVEMLVAMLIFGVLGSIVTAGLASASRSSSQNARRGDSAEQINQALERLTRDIRATDPYLRSTTSTLLTADVFGATTCRRVNWRVQSGKLQRQVIKRSAPGGANTNAAAGCTSPLAQTSDTGYVDQVTKLTTGVTAFAYQTASGAAATSGATTKAVVLTLSSTPVSGRAPVSITTIVTLRNN